MKTLALFVLAVLMVSPGAGESRAAALRDAVTVDSEVVRLGDLFADVGARADIVVAAAPAPGRNTVFSAERLRTIAREAGLGWRPRTRYQRVVVERRGRRIGRDEIEDGVRRALIAAGLPPERRIAIARRNLVLYAAPGAAEPFRVRRVRFDERGGRFAAILEVAAGAGAGERIRLSGRILDMVEVPVLARPIRRGEIIRADDIEIAEMPREAIDRNAILDVARIVGKTPRRTVRSRTPLRPGDLRPPVVVAKGALVTLVLRTERMLITARGRALDNAAMGEVVRVRNTRSRSTIEGVVAGPNTVSVALPGATP